ncbi:hypothetical protein AALA13_18680 [Lachnospiraceae bacterium 50-23]
MGDNNYYCKIDGTVYNLKKIQDIIDENPENMGVKIDLALFNEYHLKDPTVYVLSNIIKKTGKIPTEYNTPVLPEEYMRSTHVLQCPRCGSTDIKKYEKFVDWERMSAFDYSLVYNYRCRKCRHEWK